MAQHALGPGAGLVGADRPRGGRRVALHGGEDPPARSQDLQVALALQAHLELGGAVAGPDQVGVRVDKAGHHHPPVRVQLGSSG